MQILKQINTDGECYPRKIKKTNPNKLWGEKGVEWPTQQDFDFGQDLSAYL